MSNSVVEASEPVEIAIVGIGCRLPGGIEGPEAFWAALCAGIDGVGDVPADRWNIDEWLDADPSAPGRMNTRAGAFLADVRGFDASLFGIAPAEATQIDPQQRIALETAWSAIEDALLAPSALRGTRTGVFFGAMWQEYGSFASREPQAISAYSTTGWDNSLIPARIAFVLGLHGPVMMVGTASSSSLLAVHLARQSLAQGECDLALAGGVNLILSPHTTVMMTKLGTQSPDGRCRAFDADANGYVRGEGCGVVVLRRLSDARAAGDRIYAVARGSAVNNDGASSGLTAPNPDAQVDLLATAWRAAGIAPGQVSYVETHGTGTPLGDPIETSALGRVFGAGREHPLLLGSVKTNLGHLEAAAGIAGLIKAALALFHAELPANLHFERPNPNIDFDRLRLAVVDRRQPWPSATRRLAGVSSFGLGGTNVHVALEAAPPSAAAEHARPVPEALPLLLSGNTEALPLLLSGNTEAALRAQAAQLRDRVQQQPELSLQDLAYSLATTRAHLAERAAVVVRDPSEAHSALDALAQGRSAPLSVLGRSDTAGKTVFVFPGQGSQWRDMARAMLEASPVFRAQLEACDRAFAPFLDVSLLALLRGEHGDDWLDRTERVQPALFSVNVSLAALWRSMGVEPDAVVGHSQGEIAAAFVAGALSLEQAAKVVAVRSRALQRLTGKSAMAAVGLGVDGLRPQLVPWGERISIAAINSPRTTLVSGDSEAITALLETLAAKDIFARRIRVDYGSHCAHVEAARDELLGELGELQPAPAAIPVYSTVDPEPTQHGADFDADYWYRNLRQTVRFAEAIERLQHDGYRFFIEVSAHPVLTLALQEILEHTSADGVVVGSLRSNEGGFARFFASLAELHTRGRDLDWSAILPEGRRIPLPSYPFQRESYWLGSSARANAVTGTPSASLGLRLRALPPAEQTNLLLALVRAEAATVLGLPPDAVEPDRPLKELRLGSLMALELRSRLAAVSGLRLKTSLLFDYPTANALASFLRSELLGQKPAAVSIQPSSAMSADDPIAIVSMSCRFPGGVRTSEDLWTLLRDGRDAIAGFPDNRGWSLDTLRDNDTRHGGFVYDADRFDPAFFGISPRESLAIDPQQRLLLETVWETFERAGIDPDSVRGSQTAVFVGLLGADYGSLIQSSANPDTIKAFLATASAPSVASGRIAYTFGLDGPAITIDTACSSSLVATHLACQALRQGECTLALAGGATIMATPFTYLAYGEDSAGAPDGRCKSFSASADGAGWSEGAGMLLLERRSDAERHGHPILALLRGSAVNQDGRSQGLTAPNGPAQERVIRQALANARLTAQDIDAVEAHGTGTVLGDPIEAHALLATYGQAHAADHPLWLGSLKSNLGHMQAAAGVGGVIKMVLALQHGVLPKTLHADERSPHIDWSAGAVELLRTPVEWPRNGHPRRAAVSSFGISGTNAHVILEEAPASSATLEPTDVATDALPLLLSAKTEPALRAQAGQLRDHLRAQPELSLRDLAYSLATTRTHFEHRAAVIARDPSSAHDALDALADGRTVALSVIGRAGTAGKTVFVFPGQGSQWRDMARAMLDASPVFREQLEACDRAFAPFLEQPLLELLRAEHGDAWLDRIDLVQPALFSVMVSLAALWRSQGVEPDAVVGHSQGEIAAAFVAGALSLEQAAQVVALRGRALTRIAGKSAMAAVELGVEALRPHLTAWGERISIAAINSPHATLVSGDSDAITALLANLEAAEIFARRIRVDYGSHCAHVEAVRDELLAQLNDLSPRAGSVPMYSTVTSETLDGSQLDADYWYRNLRQTVHFAEAIEQLRSDGYRFFVEISPHPVLTLALHENLESSPDSVVVGSLRREEGDFARFFASLAELHTRGRNLDWRAILPAGQRLPLPTYPFQRERYWIDPSSRADVASAGLTAAEHPFLGAAVALADSDGYIFTGRISQKEHGWLAGHTVFGRVILPGTAFLELALFAAHSVGLDRVDELLLEAPLPLPLPDSGAVQLQLSVGALDAAGLRSFQLHSRLEAASDAAWTRHITGTLARSAPAPDFSLHDWPPAAGSSVDITGLYETLRAAGFDYGTDFQGLRAVWSRGDDLFAEVELPRSAHALASRFSLHPALLDAALHALDFAATASLPFTWSGVALYRTAATALRVHLQRRADRTVALHVADANGLPLASVDALAMRTATAEQVRGAQRHDALLCVEWAPPQTEAPALQSCAVLGAADFTLPETHCTHYANLEALSFAAPPDFVVAPLLHAETPREGTARALALLQGWLEVDRFADIPLVVLTRRAVAARSDEDIHDLAHAPVWGLVRSAQTENPLLPVFLADIDDTEASLAALRSSLHAGDRQLALRQGTRLVPRLAPVRSEQAPLGRLYTSGKGSFENLSFEEDAAAHTPLPPGHVRIAVRAAGLNFRDVLDSLGMVPGQTAGFGIEGAGIVTEVAPDVVHFTVGQRVMGMFTPAFGPFAVTDARTIVPIPKDWSFVQAASVPVVFLTAYYAFVHLAELQRGQRVLIHAAAGGVGTAAVQLARHFGAEVFATASPGKWDHLRALGFDAAHLASSRDLGFETQFSSAAGERGFDVVLDCLAREFVDASLRLLPHGGHFLEMGKTDIRDPDQVAAAHPGVRYRAFDLMVLEPELIGSMLGELLPLFERGVLRPPPITTFGLRQGPDAFRALARAAHIGKLVLTVPHALDRDGTILITGGTGTLGAKIARHLVTQHGATHLLLSSRQGAAAPGAGDLLRELEALGASVAIAACDVSERAAVQRLLSEVPAAHPLTAVIHTAGVLDDGLIGSLTDERIARVFAPKLDAALHLHELTQDCDLAAFVTFSSVAGLLGTPGQANYAAANSFLDALAQHRRAHGLPALSLAWGFWQERSGMTRHLASTDTSRLSQHGLRAISSAEGLALFDDALPRSEAALAPALFDRAVLRARADALPSILRKLAGARTARPVAGQVEATSLGQRLSSLPAAAREQAVLELVRREAATVLGIASADALEPKRPLKELGLDSLMAVELRNRLAAVSGKRLHTTVLFDYPTTDALARFLLTQLIGNTPAQPRTQALAVALAGDEPIAVVSIGCRFPGGVRNTDEFWTLLYEARDAISALPDNRGWSLDDFRASNTREGGFVYEADRFDPTFFGISPREAVAIDPQQRLLLETTWETFERAGIDPLALAGTNTGVFVGVFDNDYRAHSAHCIDDLKSLRVTGNLASVASGRIAYTFGLEGPALSIDTACSSSLVAIHLACQALRHGECTLALAGGVTVMATAEAFRAFGGEYSAGSPDGRCKSFSAQADGAGWAEGAGVLLLERVSDAQRHGHPILALVRGSAINQDGRSQGLTAPNGPAQERVIRQALDNAGLDAQDVDAVEAHGTGTALGDPIEATALLATYGRAHTAESPLWLGSLKSNLGHMQAAAGVGGVIKMVLALSHGVLPKTLHSGEPSPHIDWSAGAVQLLQERVEWPRHGSTERPRRAGVSSFGIAGTNAHVILEEAPAKQAEPELVDAIPDALPLLLSAKTDAALHAQIEQLRDHLVARPELSLRDLAYSLATTRVHFEHRAAVVARNPAEAIGALDALARGQHPAHTAVGRIRSDGKVAFVFPGQGSQWRDMARDMLEASPVFRSELEACDRAFARYLDPSVVSLLRGEHGDEWLDRIDLVQPVLFSVAVSLAALWRSLGVEPDAVVGHSQGEVAASYVAGALSLEQAAQIIGLRSRALTRIAGKSGMAAVELGVDELLPHLAPWKELLSVAAINSPHATIVSGDNEAISALLQALEAAQVVARRIRSSVGTHCAGVDTLHDELLTLLDGLRPSAASIPIYSTVTLETLDGSELDQEYWFQNMRQPVRFAGAIERLRRDGHRFFIEISPHPVIGLALNATLDDAAVVGTLRRDDGGFRRFFTSLAELHTRGGRLDWKAILPKGRRIELPTYPFQRERYWIERSASGHADVASAGLATAAHPLLGACVALADSDGCVFTGRISRAEHAWLAGHAAFDTAILPGTAFVELALFAAHSVGLDRVEELTLEAPLPLPESAAVVVQLQVGAPGASGDRSFQLHSRLDAAASWTRHATGTLAADATAPEFDLREWPPAAASPVDLTGAYETLAAAGYAYAGDFQGLRAAWSHGDAWFAEVELPRSAHALASQFSIHPALLDAALHPIALDASSVSLPFSWSGVSLYRTAATALRVRIQRRSADSFSVEVADASGEPLASVETLTTRAATAEQVRGSQLRHDALLRVEWIPAGAAGTALERCAVLGAPDFSLPDTQCAHYDDLESIDALPDVVVAPLWEAETPREATTHALALLQRWIASERFAETPLIVLTQRAIATRPDEDVLDLAHAPVWGLVRSAQTEHPELPLVLVDTDGSAESLAALRTCIQPDERQIALRAGARAVPRLARIRPPSEPPARALNPQGTVLITGGTGTLGGQLARHLVAQHGVRHLLLTSRQGAAAPGAEDLARELEALGASVTLAACDVSDREGVQSLLAAVPAQHPLTAVIHSAAALDDGMLAVLTDERVDRVFAPKLDAARHLHELTQSDDLAAFVLFSSAAGVLGTAGQANYAAANSFLDALAHHRRANGLPAHSIAWGFWQERSSLTQHLGVADLRRMQRMGLAPLSSSEGLALFDAALQRRDALLVASPIDRTQSDALPSMLRDLGGRRTHKPAAAQATATSLAQRLRSIPDAERTKAVLSLVRSEAATVLGLPSPDALDAERPLKELGLDSLMAVELRNRLAAASGARLKATLLFDYPTAGALAQFLLSQLLGRADKAPESRTAPAIAAGEPIAIVAMSCRFPGGVSTGEELWALLFEGRDAISSFPDNRGWSHDTIRESVAREGGFVYDADRFDPTFFGISPRETIAIDPQQRLLLETAWESFEHAGIDPHSLRGTRTGVFVGLLGNDYSVLTQASDLASVKALVSTGSAPSVASGRIAYTFGLEGPAITVDTACSSSLVATHLACQALRHGECDLALAGGVTVNATPRAFVVFGAESAAAPDGRCKSFSARADGAGWSEGAGVLLLERLADAQRNEHPVLALLRGSAVNQDGRSQGLTAPNGPAQERVIRQALDNAGLSARDVDAVEAHGTGTTLGDPIEAHALLATYGEAHAPDSPLWLGSLKSNLGHMQAAAGVGGIVKMVLALAHGVLPKTLHADEPSPHIDWSAGAVKLLQDHVAWPRRSTERPRRAGVSSFGISGTNAHVILEEAPQLPAELEPSEPTPDALPLLLSAKTEPALRAQAALLRDHLLAQPDASLRDLAYSLATTRAHFEHRAAVIARDPSSAHDALDALAEGRTAARSVVGRTGDEGKTVFVFPGQGSQWRDMARAMLDASPVFREQLEACDRAFAPFLEQPLLELLGAEHGDAWLDRIDLVQPALFSVMVSLAALWRSQGVEPDAVVGHSQGEIAAAFVAGALSLEQAAQVVALRGRALTRIAGKSAMAAVELGVETLRPHLTAWGERISIAAINSPHATLVSGDSDAITALLASLDAAEIFARRIRVDYGSHCAHVEAVRDELLAQLNDLSPRAGSVPMYSTVTSETLDGSQLDADYWYRNLRQTVHFAEAATQLRHDGYRFFVEVSPHPVLTLALHENLDESAPDSVVVGSLRREEGDFARFFASLAELHTHGRRLDWSAILPAGRRLPLPTYPFQRERYWIEPNAHGRADVTAAGLTAAEHPFLGAAVALADSDGYIFTGRITRQEQPWLAGHAVFGTVILPGTAFLELALFAAHSVGLDRVDELTLEAPLPLPDSATALLQLHVGEPDAAGLRSFQLHSRLDANESSWSRHATGTLAPATPAPAFNLHAWPPSAATPLDLTGAYATFAAAGYEYAGDFQGLRAAWSRGDELFAEVELPRSAHTLASRFALHPALLDAALHPIAMQSATTGLPFSWSGVSLYRTAATALRVRIQRHGADRISAQIADASGDPLAAVDTLAIRAVTPDQLRRTRTADDALLYLEWLERPIEPGTAAARSCAVLGAPDFALADLRCTHYADLDAFESAPGLPDLVVAPSWHAQTPREGTARALALLQRWIATERFADTPLIVLTRRAVAARPDEDVCDLAHAPVWGLVRSAQSEHPQLPLFLVDIDDSAESLAALRGCTQGDERQFALRCGKRHAPRLAPALRNDTTLDAAKRLHTSNKGDLDNLLFIDDTAGDLPLTSGQVRIAVRAAGLNFRDVLDALGMYPGETSGFGVEGAGIVLEVAPDVAEFTVGQRVMGLFGPSFGSFAIADARSIVPMPARWSFVQAASVPVVFVTAYYGLVDLGQLRAGERVLIHAAAGGVGSAAVQLARHLGAEVFATASPPKWDHLRALGFDDAHLASSRELDFEAEFLAATDGEGMDVVLDCLAREFVDASLRLLPRGGRFLEMGRTDMRDPEQVAAAHPGVRYRAFEPREAGPERLREILHELLALFERGVLSPPPITAWDLRRGPQAFRALARATHIGKFVLTVPRALDPHGTVLITGGTGTLGGLLARHLVTHHGVRSLLLTSRQGAAAPGADRLVHELEALGANVTLAACDVSDRSALAQLLANVPLTAVIHTAAVLDDGLIGALTGERIDRVFAPKLDAALHLHELTQHCDLAAFVLFSSAAGVLGGPGQANYAAANSFLDALAHHRRAQGLPGLSLAWGFWQERSALTSHLQAADLERLQQMGVRPISSEEGLALFDDALQSADAALAPAPFDRAFLRAAAHVPPVLRKLAGQRAARPVAAQVDTASLGQRLSALPPDAREQTLLELVRREAATVLGLPSAESLEHRRALKELGLDSLLAVELRNRLAVLSGLRLKATLLFDHPTVAALARFLLSQLVFEGNGTQSNGTQSNGTHLAEQTLVALDRLEVLVNTVHVDPDLRASLATRLETLLAKCTQEQAAANGKDLAQQLDDASDDELLELVDSVAQETLR